MQWGRPSSLAVVLICGALLLMGTAVPAAWASGSLLWGQGIRGGVPANAATPNPQASLGTVSCASAGNCTAGGQYTDGSNNPRGLLLTESAGSWANGVAESPVPANGSTHHYGASVYSVSCPLAGTCGAVGYYVDDSQHRQGLLLAQSGGSWTNGATEATLPGPTPNLGAPVQSISCPSAGNCSAVGAYYDNNSYEQGLLLSESSGSWMATEAQPPGTAGTDPYVNPASVSCPTPGNCGAVGSFSTSPGSQGLLMNESAGTWSSPTVQVALPANANASYGSGLSSVSCPALGVCTAVGYYVESSHNQAEGLLVSESSGSWSSAGVEAPAPANVRTNGPTNINLTSVSCRSAGNCTAVGGYYDNHAVNQGLLLNEVHGSWSAREAQLPAHANLNPNVSLTWVSCSSAGNCAAVGRYHDAADNLQGLLLTEFRGVWSRGVEVSLPANHGTNPYVGLGSVSCPSAVSCAAVGAYTDSLGYFHPLMVSASPVRPHLSATGPSSGAVGTKIAASAVSAALTGGSAPIGKITFKVIGPKATAPSSCKSGGTLVGTANVNGNKSYHPSAAFAPHKAGNYWWYARYSGDASDTPAVSKCGAGMAKTVVHP